MAQGDPTFQQLRLFLVLAQERHFGQAARRAFITQPALSRHIQALERCLGVELVERDSRPVELSAAGHALLDQIRTVVDATDELNTRARQIAKMRSGRIVIGHFESVTSVEPIPAVLEEARRRLHGVEIEFRRGAFDIATLLLEGEVDAAFVILPVPKGVQHLELGSGPRCAALSADDPLADRDTLTLSDLADRDHIGFSSRVPKVFRDFMAVDPRPDGTRVRYSAHEVLDFESALLAVAGGTGIQMPASVARDLYPRPGIAYVDVTDLTPYSTGLAWRTADRDKPHVAALRHAAEAVAGAGGCAQV
jgi:DNA-binding transcriptional LysR family regulator